MAQWLVWWLVGCPRQAEFKHTPLYRALTSMYINLTLIGLWHTTLVQSVIKWIYHHLLLNCDRLNTHSIILRIRFNRIEWTYICVSNAWLSRLYVCPMLGSADYMCVQCLVQQTICVSNAWFSRLYVCPMLDSADYMCVQCLVQQTICVSNAWLSRLYVCPMIGSADYMCVQCLVEQTICVSNAWFSRLTVGY